MAQPNGGLITESNSQYYAGSQMFIATADQTTFTTTFNTKITFGSSDPTSEAYNTNNFRIYTSANGKLRFVCKSFITASLSGPILAIGLP